MTWDQDKTLLFIKEYEGREVLWNKENPLYFNLAHKEDVWREIGAIFGEDVEMLKKKMDSLRGSRRREKNRMLKRKARCERYNSKWFAWDSLLFLDDAKELDMPLYEPLEVVTEEDGKYDPEARVKKETEDKDEDPPPQEIASASRSRRKKSSPSKPLPLPLLRDAYDLLKRTARAKDESGAFGEFVAEKLRSMEPRTRSLLQHKMHNLIFEYEMKETL